MSKPLLNIDEQGNESNLLMIGCGPYAQSAYLPNLNAYRALPDDRVFLRTVLELEEKVAQTRDALNRWAVRSDSIEVAGISQTADYEEKGQLLDGIKEEKYIDAVLITTEPSSHMEYARWALRNKLHILMDKPISTRANASTDESQAWGVLEDYKLLAEETVVARKEKPDLAFNVAVQRRYDPDMIRLMANIREVFQATGQLPTTIEITKADGSWRFPRELFDEQYHGYDKGYGILSHTGYHIFDVLSQIIAIADGTPKAIDNVNVTSSFVRPGDVVTHLCAAEYKKVFGGNVKDEQIELTEEELEKMNTMGEVDAHITVECLSKGKTITVATINLLHQSLSTRRDSSEIEDKYMGAGRTKYESIKVFQGPFAQHEYVNNHATGEESSRVMLNGLIHGGKRPVKTVKNKIYRQLSDAFIGLFNKKFGWKWKADMPRVYLLREFVRQIRGSNQEEPYSDILNHHGAASLMAAAYASGARRFNGENPMVSLPYKTNFEHDQNQAAEDGTNA
jgi:predicted dehydrogenase